MQKKPYTSYNLYFLIPFLLWVILGGLLLVQYSQIELFKAINTSYNSVLDTLMLNATLLGEGLVIAIVLLSLLARKSLRNWWYFVAALLCTVLPSLLVQVIKRSFGCPRPLKVYGTEDWIHSLSNWPHPMENSFPSGHTCGAFCLFTFLSILLKPKYRPLGFLFFLLALLVGYTRAYLAVHFFADIYIGSIIGTICTFIIIALMNKYQSLFLSKNK